MKEDRGVSNFFRAEPISKLIQKEIEKSALVRLKR